MGKIWSWLVTLYIQTPDIITWNREDSQNEMHSAARGGGEDGSTPKGDSDADNLESGGYHRNNHHDSSKFSGVALRIALLFAVAGISCLLLFQSSYPFEFFRKSFSFSDSKISSPPSCENRAEQSIAPTSSFHQYTSQNLPPPVSIWLYICCSDPSHHFFGFEFLFFSLLLRDEYIYICYFLRLIHIWWAAYYIYVIFSILRDICMYHELLHA